jgi:hypothetical protein
LNVKTILICHHDDRLNREGLAAWLGSFTDLAGLIVIREPRGRVMRRIRREIRRVGLLRFADVLAFRIYYSALLSDDDRRWAETRLAELGRRYGPPPVGARLLETSSPNTSEVASFIEELQPDLMIARCKLLLRRRIFTIPARGTFVLHPGICPQYRNAHGCFWALVRGDRENIGTTLLKIDEGVDTGPVFGYFRCQPDERNESHIVIQHRAVLDNLDALSDKLLQIGTGEAIPIDTSDRPSGEWGQPWLTSYLAWKHRARRGPRDGGGSPLS